MTGGLEAVHRTVVRFTVVAAAALLAPTASLLGVLVTVANPGFEADPISAGCFAVFIPSGWAAYDPNNILNAGGNVIGGVNCTASPWFPSGAPEGEHAGIIFLADTIGAGPAGYAQVLGDTLLADMTYTLSVQVGNIASGTGPPPCDIFGFFNLDGFPGYRVQLLAGGVVVAEDDNSLSGTIPEGEFRPTSVAVTIGDAHPQLGAALEIRLINLNVAQTPEQPGIEVDFDDVQLVAEPAVGIDGDFDDDGDVDTSDFAVLAQCFGGANLPPASSCPAGMDADLDHDGDVDSADFAIFAQGFTGSQ